METALLVPLSEYLHTVYRPDCDYVDGEVQERNSGELDHSDLQGRLLQLFSRGDAGHFVRANAELRVQVATARYRVPDICVRAVPSPREQIVSTPPLLCIEILSPEDRVARMRERVKDFLDMGVLEVWLVDPASRTISVCAGSSTVEHAQGELTVPSTPVTISLQSLFEVLDE